MWRAARPAQQECRAGLSYGTPLGSHVAKITGLDVHDEESGTTKLKLCYRIEGGEHEGKDFHHEFYLASGSETLAKKGEALFDAVRRAVAIPCPQVPEELHDKTLVVNVTEGANDGSW